MQITRNLLLEQINDILDEAEKEVKRNHSSNSQWGEKELQYVVIPEMKELKQYAVKGTVYFKYGERQKMLESTYLIIDSLNAVDSTSLGKKILLLQHTLNTTR